MKRKKGKPLSVCSPKSIREAVCERFQAVCGQDAGQCAKIMGQLEKSLEPEDGGSCILYFDRYGYPVFLISEFE